MSTGEIIEKPLVEAPKQRDALFDVAKGIGILLVLGHHSFSNSARLYTVSHSILWWILTFGNRILSFSVPVFLLISAILSARGLINKPAVGPFYRRRFPALIWPYLVWTFLYWCARMLQDPNARKRVPASIFGHVFRGPALLVHFRERFLDLFWGKAYFHMYFMVVLFELLLLLPLAVKYVRWRKPGFWETLFTAFVLQGVIMVIQHVTAWMPYPGSCALWYLGSLLPGAWIGSNWDLFKEECRKYIKPLSVLIVITGTAFLSEEVKVILGVEANNYLTNGSLTIYASCLSVIAVMVAMTLTEKVRWRKVLEPLGKNSLQIYLIHPGVMAVLERPRIASLLSESHIAPILSPALMLSIVLGMIWFMRTTKIEKLFFGR